MSKKLATTKGDGFNSGFSHLLQCCMCGENDRDKLVVEDMGISLGMSGNNYSFCKKCWHSKNFGKNLLDFLGYPNGLKLKNEVLEIKVIEYE